MGAYTNRVAISTRYLFFIMSWPTTTTKFKVQSFLLVNIITSQYRELWQLEADNSASASNNAVALGHNKLTAMSRKYPLCDLNFSPFYPFCELIPSTTANHQVTREISMTLR